MFPGVVHPTFPWSGKSGNANPPRDFLWGAFFSLPSSAILSHLSTQHPASPQAQLSQVRVPVRTWLGLWREQNLLEIFKKIAALEDPFMSLPLASCSSPWRVADVAHARLTVPAHSMSMYAQQAEWSVSSILCTKGITPKRMSNKTPAATFKKPTLPSNPTIPHLAYSKTLPNANLSWTHGPPNNQRPDVPMTARWEMFFFKRIPHQGSPYRNPFRRSHLSKWKSKCRTTGTQNIPPRYQGAGKCEPFKYSDANVAQVWLTCGYVRYSCCSCILFHAISVLQCHCPCLGTLMPRKESWNLHPCILKASLKSVLICVSWMHSCILYTVYIFLCTLCNYIVYIYVYDVSGCHSSSWHM